VSLWHFSTSEETRSIHTKSKIMVWKWSLLWSNTFEILLKTWTQFKWRIEYFSVYKKNPNNALDNVLVIIEYVVREYLEIRHDFTI
jgi:hypothetical protein